MTEKCWLGETSCIACIQWNREKLKVCYPLLAQTPPHPDRFLHIFELKTVIPFRDFMSQDEKGLLYNKISANCEHEDDVL